jgi:hypothetical protein
MKKIIVSFSIMLAVFFVFGDQRAIITQTDENGNTTTIVTQDGDNVTLPDGTEIKDENDGKDGQGDNITINNSQIDGWFNSDNGNNNNNSNNTENNNSNNNSGAQNNTGVTTNVPDASIGSNNGNDHETKPGAVADYDNSGQPLMRE